MGAFRFYIPRFDGLQAFTETDKAEQSATSDTAALAAETENCDHQCAYVSSVEEDVASGDAVGIWNPSTPSLPSVRREIYFSCNDGSVQAQQNQLALWFSLAIWFFTITIMSWLCCLCLPMCAIERDVKRSQSTQMNQSNQLFHIFFPLRF